MSYSNGKKTAYINIILVLLNVIYFIYLEAIGNSQDTVFMIEHGAMYAPYVIEQGEYYRLVSSVFMHFGIDHIMNNMLILLILGDNLERALGSFKYLFFYILCGVGANMVSMLINIEEAHNIVSAGASGAIFGVIGGLLFAVIVNRGRLEDLNARQLVIMIVCSLYFGFTSSGVDNIAHLSGLIIGFVLALILYRWPDNRDDNMGN